MKRLLFLLLFVLTSCMWAQTGFATEEQKDTGQSASLLSEYWTEGSEAAENLNAYLQAVTDESSPDFIPVEDRIAVFDLDGTLMCETCPFCFEYMVFSDYVLNHSDQMPKDVVAVAQEIEDAVGKEKPDGMSTRQASAGAIAYQGKTMSEIAEMVRDFKESEAWGFSGMTRGEAYYKPMVELFNTLLENDFTVYIVTATERNIVREVIKGTLDIPPSHVIGTEYGYMATNQGEEADGDYTFQPTDQVVFDGTYEGENAKTSKVDAIVREIGQQPVLAFGNSSGDLAMEIYTIANNPYKSAAYMVVADDEEREYGDEISAGEKKKKYTEQGIGIISMKDDFKTIYGDDVVKTPQASADDPDPDAETETQAKTLTIQISPENFSDKGNVRLPLGREEMEGAGFSFGDMLTVKIGDQTLDLPYGSSYSDVDSGSPVLICRDQDENARLTVNMGNFVAEYLQGVRDEEKGEWKFPEETTWPLTVTISMKEKGGYYDEYLLHRLSYTNERNDYPNLTDEEFGNFREVTTTGMGKEVLYRCSSPIDPKIGRNLYADQAIRDAGVTVVMNLTDTAEKAENYEGFKDSYYATTDFIPLSCEMDFTTDSFRKKLREGLEFFAGHPGVYAVHCLEGKDRTGIVIALLECLMGADLQEVVDDYMITFYNYYGVTRDDERYETIVDSNILKSLKNMFGVRNLESADLSKCAEEYLAGIGMSPEEIKALENNLSADVTSLSPAA